MEEVDAVAIQAWNASASSRLLRLRHLQSGAHAGAWLTMRPGESTTTFCADEYQGLLRFRCGVSLGSTMFAKTAAKPWTQVGITGAWSVCSSTGAGEEGDVQRTLRSGGLVVHAGGCGGHGRLGSFGPKIHPHAHHAPKHAHGPISGNEASAVWGRLGAAIAKGVATILTRAYGSDVFPHKPSLQTTMRA